MIRVVGVGCVSGLGDSWSGISERLEDPVAAAAPVDIGADHGRAERLASRLMSRGAVLGHLATRAALADAGWSGDVADVGFFMGVGASGGSGDQLEAMLAASQIDGALSLERFGTEGLRACNPLYAFQLMNNFAMCHAAILAGVRGPNAALFSRGAGTATALTEAIAALEDGEVPCERALVGGADTAIDPVTEAELGRAGWLAEGLRPAEGAAVLALSRRPGDRALAVIESAGIRPDRIAAADAAVVTGWGPAPRRALIDRAAGIGEIVDLGAVAGDALAATPALGWAVAIDLVRRGRRRVAALSCGIDGEITQVVFASAGARPSARARTSRSASAGADRAPVITGAGVVSPFGLGLERFLDQLAAGASAVGPIGWFDAASFPTRFAAEVPADAVAAIERPADLPPGAWRDRKLRFALAAAAEAWAAAGCGPADAAIAHLSLAVGLEQAFLEDFDGALAGGRIDWARERERARREPQIRTRSPIDLVGDQVRRRLGLGGPVTAHVSACAAGALAVAHAASLIRRGLAELVVCGGADSMINPLGIGGMSRLGAPSPRAAADACRPFDRRRDGLAMGEGAAVFVLESRARAEARGARPLASVRGWASTQDGYKATAPRPDGSAAAAAMAGALRRAGVGPGDIDYINAHGTGTPLNDPTEVAAIRRAFGDAAASIPISSIKGAVGHLMAAAGAIEIAACLLPLTRDRLPGTAHLDERALDCALDIVGPGGRAARVETALTSSFGFGGQNACVVLGRTA